MGQEETNEKQYWRQVILDNTHYHEQFIDIILAHIKQLNSDLETTTLKHKSNPEPDESGWRLDDHLGDMSHDIDVMSNTLFKSFVLAVLMYMESKLLGLCDHLQKEEKQKFNVRDLEGTGMRRSIKYLNLILDTNFVQDAQLKKDLMVAILIRNSITHADGVVDNKEDRSSIQKYMDTHPSSISLDSDDNLFINENYARELISINEKIFEIISYNWRSVDL
ncbi:MAG TPA: hypothetical protein VHQ20_01465 [Patescibacteria group bacterium]|jgi:hypothetical protein|nr:hypothetical protein [Patescibacteria group bacterium]